MSPIQIRIAVCVSVKVKGDRLSAVMKHYHFSVYTNDLYWRLSQLTFRCKTYVFVTELSILRSVPLVMTARTP